MSKSPPAAIPKQQQQGGSPIAKQKGKKPKTKKTVFLTEEEKKKHHIESEHKRRQAIRDAFSRLVELVPELKPSDNRSEILILNKSADYLDALLEEQKSLVGQLEKKGVEVEERLKCKNTGYDCDFTKIN